MPNCAFSSSREASFSNASACSTVIVVALLSSAFARASEIALMLESTERTELAFPETALATPKPPE